MKSVVILLSAFDGVTRVKRSANKSCTAFSCSLTKFMLLVEGTAGSLVLQALQNVIESVRRNYKMHDCPDLSVTLDSFKVCDMYKRWRAAELFRYSSTAMEHGQVSHTFVLATYILNIKEWLPVSGTLYDSH